MGISGKITLYLLIIICGTAAGWFLFEYLVLLMKTEGVEIASTRLTDAFLPRLRFSVLSGFTLAVIYHGTLYPLKFNRFIRFLILFLPVIILGTGSFLLKRNSISALSKMPDMNVPLIVPFRNLEIELIALTALAVAVVGNYLIFRFTVKEKNPE